MKVLIPGHQYLLSNIKSDDGDRDVNILKFYNEKGTSRDDIIGTSNQEVLRALIDRVNYLDNELPHSFNKEIIFHLRKALALHEARHLTRMIDKDVAVENFPVGDDGHFICLDKETEYFYRYSHQKETNDNPDAFLADLKKDMSRKRKTEVGFTGSPSSTQDEQTHLLKEVEGYREKKLFLDLEQDYTKGEKQ